MTDLDVVSKLQVVGKRNRMRSCNVAESLEVVHGELKNQISIPFVGGGSTRSTYRVTLNPDASNELGQHIEGHLNARHSLDDSHRNDKYQGERHTVRHYSWCGECRPASDSGKSKSCGDNESTKIPPLRDWC